MPLWVQFVIADVASLGIIVLAKHIAVSLEILRRPAHPDTPLKNAPSSACLIPPAQYR
jgi:hypothetical protein